MSAADQPSSAAIPVDEPTVLLVAEGERLAPALKARLVGRGLIVETASPDDAVSAAFVAAPDLVVLAGDAARDGGMALLEELASRPVTSALPVVLVTDPAEERPPSSAFRFGVVGVVDRTASADEMARHIEDLVRELPEREGEASGVLGEATVDEVIELFAESLRSGVLSVRGDAGPAEQIVVRADRPVQDAIAELVERLRPLISQGALRYEFHESPTARLSSLDDLVDVELGASFELTGRRVLLIERNPARSDLLTQALRGEGALVAVVDGSGSGLELARELMPEVVLIDGRGVEDWAREALRAIRRDPWLRWASLLVADEGRLWANPRRPDLATLAPKILELVAPDREIASRAAARSPTMTRLDVIGPIRLLRALAETQLGLRVSVQHARVRVEVDLADGLVAGASARAQGERESVEGPSALATLVGLGSGRVQITHEDAPRTASVMAAPDDALAAAARERPAVAPSIPPPSLPPPSPAARRPSEDASAIAAAGSLPNMVRKLEVLLDALSRATRAGASADEEAADEELPGFDEPDDEITGLYEPRLVDRLRKRAQRSPTSMAPGSPSAPPAVAVPPPQARIPKPRPLPPRRPVPGPGAPPPARPPGPKTASPARGDAGAEPERSGRRRRPGRAGSRTLVLGSVQEPPLPAAEMTPAVPPPPPPPEPDPEPEHSERSALETAGVEDLPAAAHAPAEPTEGPAGLDLGPDGLAEIEASYDPPVPPPGPVVEHDPFVPPGALPPASPVEPVEAPVVADAPAIPGMRPRLAIWLVAAGAGALLLLGLLVAAFVLWPSDAPPGEAVAAPAPEAPAPPAPEAPEVAAREAPEVAALEVPGEPPEAPVADVAPPPEVPVAEAAPPPAPAGHAGIPPGAPVEGTDEGFDLATYGIEPAPAPPSRRIAHRRHEQMILRANRLRRAGTLDEAEAAYHELLGTFPESTRGTAGLARVWLERQNPAAAVPFAQRLVRLRPDVANNWVFLGDVLRDAGDRDAARRAYERALEDEPRSARARERLADL